MVAHDEIVQLASISKKKIRLPMASLKVCMAWRSRSWAWSVARVEAVADGVCGAWEGQIGLGFAISKNS
ncbi:hypothetical protein ES288_A01G080600v1 [Gossypium darwinii]|uniref:Uncharacterized protein n=1 Tax=Gossypium darwinii TaxID=34276 RepID=A0A5D2HJC3_GOSDA|nr:hypothetical protein ES288_A01G080600v1 [Gossypium darwinii]